MAEEWIKFRKKLPTDGRVISTARKCNASSVSVLGALVTLWILGDDHCDENGLLNGYTGEDVDRAVGLPGFHSALPTDWYSDIDGTPQLPNYQQHNGSTARARALTLERVKKHRNCNAASVAKALPDERKEERGKRKEERKKKGDAPAAPAVRFSPPTLDDVSAYCQERSNAIDPEAFLDFYASKGWRVGNQPMKDWKAAVRTWEKRQKADHPPASTESDLSDADMRLLLGEQGYAEFVQENPEWKGK